MISMRIPSSRSHPLGEQRAVARVAHRGGGHRDDALRAGAGRDRLKIAQRLHRARHRRFAQLPPRASTSWTSRREAREPASRRRWLDVSRSKTITRPEFDPISMTATGRSRGASLFRHPGTISSHLASSCWPYRLITCVSEIHAPLQSTPRDRSRRSRATVRARPASSRRVLRRKYVRTGRRHVGCPSLSAEMSTATKLPDGRRQAARRLDRRRRALRFRERPASRRSCCRSATTRRGRSPGRLATPAATAAFSNVNRPFASRRGLTIGFTAVR